MSILDDENFKFMRSLAKGSATASPVQDPQLETGVQGGEEGDLGEGFAAVRKPRPLDKAPEFVRGALKGVRAVTPGATVAGLGALAGMPFGVGAPLGAAAALGSKAIYDMGSPLVNAFLGNELLPSSNVLVDKALDYLGVPYPETEGEQSVFNIGRAGIDSIGGGYGIGKMLAKGATPAAVAARGAAASMPARVGAVMQEGGPIMDVASGMSGQAAVEFVDPSGEYPLLVDLPLSVIGGMVPGASRAIPGALFGSRELTPAHTEAMRMAMEKRGLIADNSGIARTPKQMQDFIQDAKASGTVAAGVKGLFGGRNPLESMANRMAVKNAEDDILRRALSPQEAIANIDAALASQFDENIPGFRLGSAGAAGDEGIAQALYPSEVDPMVVRTRNRNEQALSNYSTNIAEPQPGVEGSYAAAAADRQRQFVSPVERALADTDASIALQEQTIRDIELQRATAENELAAAQGRLNENAPATQRQASGEATFKEYGKQYKDLQDKMEAGNDPAELSKPISTEPIARGVSQSMDVSATALQPTNPIVENIQQQLARFGVEPGTAPEGPTMTKTVIAAQPSVPEGAAVPMPASAMTPARAAQIEAGIAGMPEPKGPVKYLGGAAPVESEVKTPGGQTIKVRRKIVELEDVVRSGNEAHPVEYQNRDRAEIASKNQINDIFGKFDPRQITGSQPSATTGAPIVGSSKNILEGGHGRLSVLERVLTEPPNAGKRAAYIDELTKSGYDVSGFKNPVEVQERVTPLTPAEVEAYVVDMNRPVVAQLSTGDMARSDSKRILSGAVAQLDPTKSLDHPANADFVRQLNSGLGSTELQPYIKSDGGPNSALVKRYQDGLNQAAYGGRAAAAGAEPSAAEAILRSMRDDTDPMVKSIAAAMDDASGGFAKLRMMVESGQIDPKYDLGQKVAEAAAFVRQSRLEGTHPIDALNQGTMFGGPDPAVASIVELFYNEGSRRQVGTKALGQTLTNMATDALQQKADLFGGSSLRSPDEIIQMAKRDIGSPERAAQAAAAQAAPVAQAAPQAPVAAPEAPQATQAAPVAVSPKVARIDSRIEKINKQIDSLSEKSAKLENRFNSSDPKRADDAKTEVRKIDQKLSELSEQRAKLSSEREELMKAVPAEAAAEPVEVGAKRSKATAAEPTEMLKDTGTAEPAPIAQEAPPPTPVEAVSVMSAPAEVLTVENAAAVLDDLNAKMRAAAKTGGVEYTNTKNELQPIIDELKAQLDSEAPNLMRAKQLYAEAAPDLIHGVTSKIRKAGPGGSPSAVQPSKTLELWFKGEPSAENSRQLAAIMGKTPENVDAVRQYAVSSVAAKTGEKATGSGIRAWLSEKAAIFSQPEFASIGEEIRQYANQIDNESTKINQAGKDIEAARNDLMGLRRSRSETESNLSSVRKTADEAASMKVASGDAGIREVLSNPAAAREAVSAASTPEARADLDNTVREYIDRSIKNTAVNTSKPTDSTAVQAENLNDSLAKTIRLLTGKGKREALSVLTSEDHVRRLDMLANALESEGRRTKLTRGGGVIGSDTAPKSATERAISAASPFFRRTTMAILNTLSDTTTARHFLADINMNPELLREILKMYQGNSTEDIGRLLKMATKVSPRAAATLGQRDSGWRKREENEAARREKK